MYRQTVTITSQRSQTRRKRQKEHLTIGGRPSSTVPRSGRRLCQACNRAFLWGSRTSPSHWYRLCFHHGARRSSVPASGSRWYCCWNQRPIWRTWHNTSHHLEPTYSPKSVGLDPSCHAHWDPLFHVVFANRRLVSVWSIQSRIRPRNKEYPWTSLVCTWEEHIFDGVEAFWCCSSSSSSSSSSVALLGETEAEQGEQACPYWLDETEVQILPCTLDPKLDIFLKSSSAAFQFGVDTTRDVRLSWAFIETKQFEYHEANIT